MRKIQTVLGPIEAHQLGRTLVHEHLYIRVAGGELDPKVGFDRAAFVVEAVRRLKDLKQHGVRTFVDPCPIELGRDVTLMAEISEKAEMHLICSTGFYYEAMGLPPYWRARSAQQIADLYLHEIENGIGQTGIRPGVIKCATGAPAITSMEEKFLVAASIAQRASGLPILTHTNHVCGPEQQAIFEKNGVPLHRCLIGHSCGNPDPLYHREVVKRGSYIGFDRIGMLHYQPDSIRADNIKRLVDGGFLSRVLMSQDRYCYVHGGSSRSRSEEELRLMQEMQAAGNWPPSYTYLFTDFIPMLAERGISQGQIETILDQNPRDFLAGLEN